LRVLLISDVCFPRVNGVSTSIEVFRREFAALGVETVLVAPEYPGATDTDPDLVRIASRTVPFDPEDRAMSWRALRARLAGLESRPFDLVHVQTPFLAHYAGVKFAMRIDAPCVSTYHTLFEEYLHHYVPLVPKAVMRGIARALSRRQCAQLDALVVPSRPMRDRLLEYGVSTPMRIVPTGLVVEPFANGDGAAFRERHGIGRHVPLLLYVGRVAHEKNIGFLFGVLERVRRACPGAELVVCGEGPALPQLRHAAASAGLGAAVHFVGYLGRARALVDCYAAADAFVFASLTETQGLVLLEAMAAGTPVVAIAAMGTSDVLVEGEGALIAPADADGFAQRVLAVLGDPARRAALGQAGARYVRDRWSARTMAERLVSYYRDLIEERRGALRGRPLAGVRPSAQ
jgi:glycosyltransferase involved in cell wall biosynthesis